MQKKKTKKRILHKLFCELFSAQSIEFRATLLTVNLNLERQKKIVSNREYNLHTTLVKERKKCPFFTLDFLVQLHYL